MTQTTYKPVHADDVSPMRLDIDYAHKKTSAKWLNIFAIAPNTSDTHHYNSFTSGHIFTVIDIFASNLEAKSAILELKQQGLRSSQIVIITQTYQEHENSMNWEYVAAAGSLQAVLIGLGIDDHDTSQFEDAVKNGKILVAALVTDRSASQAQYLLENIGRRVISVY